jgi:hypothetical protein
VPKEDSNAEMTENEGGSKESDLEEGEVAPSDGEASLDPSTHKTRDLTINDKL